MEHIPHFFTLAPGKTLFKVRVLSHKYLFGGLYSLREEEK